MDVLKKQIIMENLIICLCTYYEGSKAPATFVASEFIPEISHRAAIDKIVNY